MSDLQRQTFEALCSAFYQMPFTEFLGERDEKDGHCAYFHFGQKPKDMRVVVVHRNVAEVHVVATWHNFADDPRNPLKGQQAFTILTYAKGQPELQAATEGVTLGVLRIYQDVLAEVGVAGKLPTNESDEDDEDEDDYDWPDDLYEG